MSRGLSASVPANGWPAGTSRTAVIDARQFPRAISTTLRPSFQKRLVRRRRRLVLMEPDKEELTIQLKDDEYRGDTHPGYCCKVDRSKTDRGIVEREQH